MRQLMTLLKSKRGRPPLPVKKKRKKIAPSVADETITLLDEIKAQSGESQGEIIDRLISAEAKRLRRRQS